MVAGTNYFVKVAIGNSEAIHLRIFEPLPYTQESPRLVSVRAHKNIDDPITYF